MQHLSKFLNHWNDHGSIANLKRSDRSSDVQKAEVENMLKDMSLRYERSPNQSTIRLWANDIVDAGYDENTVRFTLKTIPFKFERCPSLKDIMDLLRPNMPQESFSESELDRYTRLCLPHVKGKFLTMLKQEQLDEMRKIYMKNVSPGLAQFSIEHQEMCVLLDWLRSYFSDGKAILAQGLRSNQAWEENSVEYFVSALKRYAKENNLL